MMALQLIGALVFFIALGMPIAFSIAVSAVLGIILGGFSNFTMIPAQMYDGVGSFTLMAIPMFSLMGEIMSHTSLGKQLINIGNAIVGWIKGGLGMATVVTCMMFGTISGSAVAGAAALGSILIPQMEKRGYPKPMAAALMSSASTLAIIIPPSSALIMYGVIAQVSIAKLFIAAVIPGIVAGIGLMIVCYIMARKMNLPTEDSFSLLNVFKAIKDGFGALIIPIVIFGGIFSGVFTPTEAAAVSVFVALIAGFRELKLKDIPKMLVSTAKSTATVTFLIAASMALSSVFAYSRVPQTVTAAIVGFTNSKVVIIMLLNVVLLGLGCILHGSAATLLVTPLALPLIKTLGIDPIHFGIMLTLNVGIGQQTPPVASVLITICSVAKLSIEAIWPYLKWFLVASLITLLIISYVPWLSLCLF